MSLDISGVKPSEAFLEMQRREREERQEGDRLAFIDNAPYYKREFPDEWIAILNKKFVGHNMDLKSLIRYLTANHLEGAYVERTYVREEKPELLSSVI